MTTQAELEHDAVLRTIVAANDDLEQRMETIGYTVCYDSMDDTMMLTIGEPAPALTETVDNVLAIRVDEETNKILGFEVLQFTQRLRDHWAYARLFLGAMGLSAKGPGYRNPAAEWRALADSIVHGAASKPEKRGDGGVSQFG